MAATIKTLIEKAEAHKKKLEDEGKEFDALVNLLDAKIEDLTDKYDALGDQLNALGSIRSGVVCGDHWDIEEGLEILKKTA
jgi:peptidoglycan hydrolase CwlO-like protein